MGALCGYVGVPKGHPLYGVDYERVPDELHQAAHGSLTYSDTCHETGDPSFGICHVPEPGRPDDVWWLGFDTAHAYDLVPSMADEPHDTDVYRDFAYIQDECASLAQAIAAKAVTA